MRRDLAFIVVLGMLLFLVLTTDTGSISEKEQPETLNQVCITLPSSYGLDTLKNVTPIYLVVANAQGHTFLVDPAKQTATIVGARRWK